MEPFRRPIQDHIAHPGNVTMAAADEPRPNETLQTLPCSRRPDIRPSLRRSTAILASTIRLLFDPDRLHTAP